MQYIMFYLFLFKFVYFTQSITDFIPGGGGFGGGRDRERDRRSDGAGGDEMIEHTDTVFIQGLPEYVNEEQLAEYFAQAGKIKEDYGKPKIWIYKDRDTKRPKGECTITFDEPGGADMAISIFKGFFLFFFFV